MRRLTSLFHRSSVTPAPGAKPRPEGIAETASALKPRPHRCLNEGGHKLYR